MGIYWEREWGYGVELSWVKAGIRGLDSVRDMTGVRDIWGWGGRLKLEIELAFKVRPTQVGVRGKGGGFVGYVGVEIVKRVMASSRGKSV